MKLIVITAECCFEGEAAAVNMLFDNGMEVLHLRKPHTSRADTTGLIRQIRADYHARIVVHDYYDLTATFELKGLHLNQRNQESYPIDNDMCGKPFGELSKNLSADGLHPAENDYLCGGRRLTVSRSCHTFEEVLQSRFCDYVFLSPVFDSISKVGYKQGFTPKQLEEAKALQLINENVIALGGITTEHIPIARQYGFGGVAVLGALWSDYAFKGNAQALLKRFVELNNEVENTA